MRWLSLFVCCTTAAAVVSSSTDTFYTNQQQQKQESIGSSSRVVEAKRRNLRSEDFVEDLLECGFENGRDCYDDCRAPAADDYGIGLVFGEEEQYCDAMNLRALHSCCSACSETLRGLVVRLVASAWYTTECSWLSEGLGLSSPDAPRPWRLDGVCSDEIRELLETGTYNAQSVSVLGNYLQCIDSAFRASVKLGDENHDRNRSTEDVNVPYAVVVVVACGSTVTLLVAVGVLCTMSCRPKTTQEPDDETAATNDEGEEEEEDEEAAAADDKGQNKQSSWQC